MQTKTPKILVLVEGEKTEEKIFKRLLDVYGTARCLSITTRTP